MTNISFRWPIIDDGGRPRASSSFPLCKIRSRRSTNLSWFIIGFSFLLATTGQIGYLVDATSADLLLSNPLLLLPLLFCFQRTKSKRLQNRFSSKEREWIKNSITLWQRWLSGSKSVGLYWCSWTPAPLARSKSTAAQKNLFIRTQ